MASRPEYGHAGGGVMDLRREIGTNQFHGSAYEFLRNNDFDANDFFSNRAGKARQIYKQNDFGSRWAARSGFQDLPRTQQDVFLSHTKDSAIARRDKRHSHDPTPEMYNGDFSNWVTSAGAPDSDLRSHHPK